jgi:hypothetical protein
MSPFGPLDAKEEDQSEEERLAVARRFRKQKTERLRALVRPVIGAEPVEVGEFSTRPLEALAAVPLIGAFLALGARAGRGRQRLDPEVLLALDADTAYLLAIKNEVEGPRVSEIWSRPRSELRVTGVTQKFMRQQVEIELEGEGEPLRLYANSLRANPWAAGVVRALGGEAPEPRDLSAPPSA